MDGKEKFQKLVQSVKSFQKELPELTEDNQVKLGVSYWINLVTPQKYFPKGDQDRPVKVSPSPGSYQITFGKFKGKTIEQCDTGELSQYVQFMENKSKSEGKSLGFKAKELKVNLEAYLNSPASSEVADDMPF